MTHEAEGDTFCGRMLARLPLLQATFASSPPTFDSPNVPEDELEDWMETNPDGLILSDGCWFIPLL